MYITSLPGMSNICTALRSRLPRPARALLSWASSVSESSQPTLPPSLSASMSSCRAELIPCCRLASHTPYLLSSFTGLH